VCLSTDERCNSVPVCLDVFPGTCPISLTALVVFVVGTAGFVMVLIIFFTRTRHVDDNEEDDFTNELVNNDEDEVEELEDSIQEL